MTYLMRLLVFFIFLSTFCVSNEVPILLSMPKSGTHFIKSIYIHLTGQQIPHTHPAKLGNNAANILKRWNGKKIIYCYRDPRDALISYVNWVDTIINDPSLSNLKELPPNWRRSSYERKLVQIINGRWFPAMYSNINLAPSFIECLSRSPIALVLRFEDFIGPLAGGNLDEQIYEMQKISQFVLDDLLSKAEILEIVENSWGKKNIFHNKISWARRGTYDNPQIGMWKTIFTEKVKQKFKESKINDTLIALGYEKDANW